jgi:glycosyltransferase involved in cell wall biosynthesis
MIVLVITSDVPFVHGGHRIIARELTAALQQAGHRAEVLTTPQNRFGREFSAYLATALMDVGQTGYGEEVDRVISLRYPSYAVQHPNHVSWMVHRQREYYDLWPEFRRPLPPERRLKQRLKRSLIHAVDRALLGRARRLYAISATVAERLQRWGGHQATPLHPPAPRRDYRTEAYQPFVLGISRLHRWKRMDLLLQALAHAPDLQAVIAGDGPELPSLRELARELGVVERVRFAGAVSEAELLDLYARCRAVFFAPYHEDYGFVTVEAFESAKAVVTCSDSGGVAELVEDGVTGYVRPPDGQALGEALRLLRDDERLAEKLGAAGRERAQAMTWQAVVEELTR